MTATPRVVFAGTPGFAVPSLERLGRMDVTLAAVYTQPDRPAGRGRRPRPSPVKQAALDAGLAVHQPATLRDPEARRILAELQPDLLVVAAYGLLLPAPVLALPTRGCLNVHASLLPRWRGAAPIQRALLAGDTETGVSLMLMTRGLDEGPVLAERSCPILAEDTGGSLHDRLAVLGADLLEDALPQWWAGRLEPVPQDDALACYAAKLDKGEAQLDWRRPARELERQVRAFDPWPGAETLCQGERLRVWRAALGAAAQAPPGTVQAAGAEGLEVATGDGSLRLLELQLPGRRRQHVREFLNGHPLQPGQQLG